MSKAEPRGGGKRETQSRESDTQKSHSKLTSKLAVQTTTHRRHVSVSMPGHRQHSNETIAVFAWKESLTLRSFFLSLPSRSKQSLSQIIINNNIEGREEERHVVEDFASQLAGWSVGRSSSARQVETRTHNNIQINNMNHNTQSYHKVV